MPVADAEVQCPDQAGDSTGIKTFTLSLKLDIQKIIILIMLLMFFLGV